LAAVTFPTKGKYIFKTSEDVEITVQEEAQAAIDPTDREAGP
jgi:hypothetical protein